MGWTAARLKLDDDGFWQDWAALAAAVPVAHPLSDARYVRLAVEDFGQDAGDLWALRLATAKGDAAGMSAIAILRRRPGGRWLSLRLPILPVAPILARPDVLRPDSLRWLFQALPGSPWLLRLYDCDPAFNPAELTGPGHFAVPLSDHHTVTVETIGDFQAYWRARPRRLRGNVNSSLRKLGAVAPVRIVCVQEREHMAAAVAGHAALESSGWKGRQGTAMSAGDRYGNFYRRVLERFAGEREARVFQLHCGSTMIASQLCTLAGGTLATMKTAYLDSAAAYSPGRVLDYLMLQELFADTAVDRVEYCVQASRFDLQWATQTRLLSQIDLPRHAWVGSVLRQVRRLRRPLIPLAAVPQPSAVP